MKNLIVADTVIRMDAEGRYCLNDLHKAAGGELKDRPTEFLRLDSTRALSDEISQSGISHIAPIKAVRGGSTPGTYVCKELVYAYAMWISPAFNLKVIRAYDDLQTRGVAVAEHAVDDFLANPFKYVKMLLSHGEQLQAERDALEEERDGLKALMALHEPTINRVVRMMPGVNTTAVKGALKEMGYLYKMHDHHRVYAHHKNLFIERFDVFGHGNLYCTADGIALLTDLYRKGKLPMKKGHSDATAAGGGVRLAYSKGNVA